MFLKAVIVLGALVACQGNERDQQQYLDVQATISLFRDTSKAEMSKGFEKLKAQVAEIEVSAAAAEEKSQELVESILKLSYSEINHYQEEADHKEIDISECTKVTMEELPILVERSKKIVKDCSFNISQESNMLLNKTIDNTGNEAFIKLNNYAVEFDDCFFNQKNESCLNNLKAIVNADTEEYPKILQNQFDQTANYLINIKNSIEKNTFDVNLQVDNLMRNSVKKMINCIKSEKQ